MDIGASRGYFMDDARSRGWQVDGIEASRDCISFAEQHFQLSIQHGVLASLALKKEHYDLVHMSHVLEHLHDPRVSLEKIRDLLKRGGLLVVEVPFEFGDLFSRCQQWTTGRELPSYSVPSSHLYFFTMRSLCRLLDRSGFEVVYRATPRRNQVDESRIPLGKYIKRAVYFVERLALLGPHLEVYARRR